MNKRVHEIAKERGVPAKQVLAQLQSAGVDVTAPSSSVDEALARRVLARVAARAANGGASTPPSGRRRGADSGRGGARGHGSAAARRGPRPALGRQPPPGDRSPDGRAHGHRGPAQAAPA